MAQQDPDSDSDQPAEQFHRDRREHGGIAGHVDDDRLARLTEEERAEIRREIDKDELPIEGERDPFPPTHYDR